MITSEMLRSPEYLHQSADVYPSLIKLHCYQPPRTLILPTGQPLFDLRGQEEGVNERIYSQCYRALISPLPQEGFDSAPSAMINHPALDVHFLPSLSAWLKEYHPQSWEVVRQKIISSPLPTIGSWHIILPLLPRPAQELVVDQALSDAKMDLGLNNLPSPLAFWLPESAVDDQTADVLASRGITHLFLRRDQVRAEKLAPYVTVPTSHGALTAIIYEMETSGLLAFGKPRVENYLDHLEAFRRVHGFLPLSALDGETYGHHSQDNLFFLNWLLNHAWKDFSQPVGESGGRKMSEAVSGEIIPSTSWSCLHGLGRWSGANSCCCDGADEASNREKNHLYSGLVDHLNRILASPLFSTHRETFIHWFSSQRTHLVKGEEITSFSDDETEDEWGQSLAVDLVGLTSCGWFFGPQNPSSEMRTVQKNCLAFLEEKIE